MQALCTDIAGPLLAYLPDSRLLLVYEQAPIGRLLSDRVAYEENYGRLRPALHQLASRHPPATVAPKPSSAAYAPELVHAVSECYDYYVGWRLARLLQRQPSLGVLREHVDNDYVLTSPLFEGYVQLLWRPWVRGTRGTLGFRHLFGPSTAVGPQGAPPGLRPPPVYRSVAVRWLHPRAEARQNRLPSAYLERGSLEGEDHPFPLLWPILSHPDRAWPPLLFWDEFEACVGRHPGMRRGRRRNHRVGLADTPSLSTAFTGACQPAAPLDGRLVHPGAPAGQALTRALTLRLLNLMLLRHTVKVAVIRPLPTPEEGDLQMHAALVLVDRAIGHLSTTWLAHAHVSAAGQPRPGNTVVSGPALRQALLLWLRHWRAVLDAETRWTGHPSGRGATAAAAGSGRENTGSAAKRRRRTADATKGPKAQEASGADPTLMTMMVGAIPDGDESLTLEVADHGAHTDWHGYGARPARDTLPEDALGDGLGHPPHASIAARSCEAVLATVRFEAWAAEPGPLVAPPYAEPGDAPFMLLLRGALHGDLAEGEEPFAAWWQHQQQHLQRALSRKAALRRAKLSQLLLYMAPLDFGLSGEGSFGGHQTTERRTGLYRATLLCLLQGEQTRTGSRDGPLGGAWAAGAAGSGAGEPPGLLRVGGGGAEAAAGSEGGNPVPPRCWRDLWHEGEGGTHAFGDQPAGHTRLLTMEELARFLTLVLRIEEVAGANLEAVRATVPFQRDLAQVRKTLWRLAEQIPAFELSNLDLLCQQKPLVFSNLVDDGIRSGAFAPDLVLTNVLMHNPLQLALRREWHRLPA